MMRRSIRIIFTLCFFFTIILGAYTFSGGKTIKRSTEWAKGKIPISEDIYDVIVVGSDPEGITAAIGAARSGARVLLLGKEDEIGGLLTYGMLNTLDMSRNSEGTLLTRGIFQEFYNALGATESFDVGEAKKIFSQLVSEEKNLEYKPSYGFNQAILDNNVITGVSMINKEGLEETFFGKRIIDATQDGDVCANAGVPFTIGMEDVNWKQSMAATLVFKVGGVKWKDVETDINKYKKETNDVNCGFNKSTAWGFGKWCNKDYRPIHDNMKLRGLNIGLQKDGTVLINALQIFDVNGLDEESKLLAIKEGKEEAERIVEYLKVRLSSFKNAYFAGVADELYIRETRHIKSEYMLKPTDILGNVNFVDKIALGSYPIDIQSTDKSNSGYVIGSPDQYSIPIGCTIPQNIDNLFIIGRAAGYTSVAAGSARTVPTGMAVGESAGIAAVYTIYKDITPRELTLKKSGSKIRQLQGILKNQNVYLPEFKSEDPNANVIGYSKIKKLINMGLLCGGYNNNFTFDSSAKQKMFSNLLINVLQRSGSEKYTYALGQMLGAYALEENYILPDVEKDITGGGVARICAAMLGEYSEPTEIYIDPGRSQEEYLAKQQERLNNIEAQAWEIAKNNNYFSEEFKKDDVLTRRQAYIIAVDIVERLIGHDI